MTSKQISLNPKKLLNSKWTALSPKNKELHFMVTKLITPALSTDNLELIELEAVYTNRKQIIPWRSLADTNIWLQGWV